MRQCRAGGASGGGVAGRVAVAEGIGDAAEAAGAGIQVSSGCHPNFD